MKRTVWSVIVLLLVCITVIAGVERYDTAHRDRAHAEEIAGQLRPYAERLQAAMDGLVLANRELAERIAAHPDFEMDALEALAMETLEQHPRARSVVISDRLKVVFVRPTRGNEPLIGLDYGLHPEFMGSINRAIRSRDTVIDAPVKLLQTGRMGLVVRTPMFSSIGAFAGKVSMGVDAAGLLFDLGLLDPSLQFTPVIRRQAPELADVEILGDSEVYARTVAGFPILLPDGAWALRAAPKQRAGEDRTRSRWIRFIGGGITVLLLLLILRRAGVVGGASAVVHGRGVALRTLVLQVVLIPTFLLVAGLGWLAYRATSQLAERMEQQQAAELSRLVRDKVTAFFNVPRDVSAFNADLFRQGLLDPGQPDVFLGAFLAQFRQQPLLTFLSMGNPQGEYYAASRPPLGDDKTLRILRATLADQRAMKLFRVDDANRPIGPPSLGNGHFDARARPWYGAAVTSDRLQWYPAYRYVINDEQGLYDALGIGMSAPLVGPDGRFLGVLTADVALSQLNDFLKTLLDGLGGTAFITQTDGTLLASSGDEPIYQLDGDSVLRIRADQSDNQRIRAAGLAILDGASAAGARSVQVGEVRYLLDWRTVQLPDGPALTIALALPESRFVGPAQQAFRDIAYLIVVFLMLGWVMALFFANLFTQPLQLLEQWARRLGAGDWQATPPVSSPIREVVGLTKTLGSMAGQLQRNAAELEQRVADRTEALEAANRKLAELSATDGLTGIANRRHFDETAAAEWSRSVRSGRALALLLLDVDAFKAYNDHYGHQAGDEALKQIANVLRASTRRPGDLAARYGGEEFVVVAADIDPAAAFALAENIRAEVEALQLPHVLSPAGFVTVSIGVAAMRPGAPIELDALLGMADAALYCAKTEGRNRVQLTG